MDSAMSPVPAEAQRERRVRELQGRLRQANVGVEAYLSRLYDVRSRLASLERRAERLVAAIEEEQMRDSIRPR